MATFMVPLNGKNEMYALIDEDDAPHVLPYRWSLQQGKGTYYATRNAWPPGAGKGGKGKRVYLHRLIMQAQPGELVDHKNGDGLDCRRENLRKATYSQNRANALRGNQYGATGVRRNTGGRYSAYIADGKRRIYLGTFDTVDEASAAYQQAASEAYGAFAPRKV